MACNNCGNRNVGIFCNADCYRQYMTWLKERGVTFPVRFSLEDVPSMMEHRRRKDLLERARGGDSTAIESLKKDYRLTAIWDGKRLVTL